MKVSLRKRMWLCISVMFIGICLCISGEPFSDSSVSASDLSGKVLSVSEFRGSALDALTIRSSVVYKNGKPVLEKQFDTAGVLKSQSAYVYTDRGALAEITGTDKSGNGIWKYTYSYDKNGRFIQEVSYGAGGTEEWKKEVSYGNSGFPEKEITYNADGTVNMQEISIYGPSGLVSERKRLYPDGRLLKRTVYIYAAGSLVSGEDHYDGNGLYEHILYTYTKDGRLKTITATGVDRAIKSSTVRIYNEIGKTAMEEIYNADSSLRSRTEYAYDNHKNWIRERDGTGQYILREITYGD